MRKLAVQMMSEMRTGLDTTNVLLILLSAIVYALFDISDAIREAK